ncbi:MFS family permease [Rhizobium sp. BK591]|uniref:MFS transporter n=1 Tax=Rhizobium sp. BK591 TaxID=2586985 RepID=UPI000DDDEA4C|nr:MFS transporter [Rhizobium sp. BK591]MBB3747235.1 MFS family permease [Rhizobium sp. BK591]
MNKDADIAPDQSRLRSLRCFFLLSIFFAATGRNAYYVGTIWILAASDNNAGFIALFLALGSISEFLASAPAGYLVDCFDRRMLCTVADVSRIVVVLTTSAALILYSSYYALCGSVIFYAMADRLYLAASSAIVPSITRLERLVALNSLAYVAMQAGNMLAAIAAGWLLSAAPWASCFLLAAVTFAISMLSMPRSADHIRTLPVDYRRPVQASLKACEGEGTSRLPPLLIVSYVLIYAMGMLISALISKFVLQELQGTSLEFGTLEFCWAAGAIISMLILTLRRFSKADGRFIPIIVLLCGSAMAVFYPARNLGVAYALMAILGAGYNLSRVLIDVEIQRLVSGAKLGRAKGWMHAACMGFSLILYAGLAGAGDALGPSAAFLAFGSGMIACVAAGYALTFAKSRTSSRRGLPSCLDQ